MHENVQLTREGPKVIDKKFNLWLMGLETRCTIFSWKYCNGYDKIFSYLFLKSFLETFKIISVILEAAESCREKFSRKWINKKGNFEDFRPYLGEFVIRFQIC